MGNKPSKFGRSKLGLILDERGIKLREFAEMIFNHTGYLIEITNLSNYCTGYRQIKKIDIAKIFADTLEASITDII